METRVLDRRRLLRGITIGTLAGLAVFVLGALLYMISRFDMPWLSFLALVGL